MRTPHPVQCTDTEVASKRMQLIGAPVKAYGTVSDSQSLAYEVNLALLRESGHIRLINAFSDRVAPAQMKQERGQVHLQPFEFLQERGQVQLRPFEFREKVSGTF